jgi:Leu/Phe-tRNA-protein transferase
MLYKLKSMQGQVEGKKNVNWVVSLSLEASTYSFAKVEVDLKDWIEDNLALGFLGLNLGKVFLG